MRNTEGMKRIVIAGGTGFIGQKLVQEAVERGWEAVVLSRKSGPQDGARRVVWDGKSQGEWAKEIDGADAVVNLAGAPIIKRMTPAYEKVLRQSRVEPAEAISQAIQAAAKKPAAWINASAVGIYGDGGAKTMTEASALGFDTVARLCADWETAAREPDIAETQQTIIRIGIVLGEGGGAFHELSRPVKMLAGSPLGSGKQYLSWIHLDDLVRMIFWAIEEGIEGPINASAPNPVQNEEMMSRLRDAYGVPTFAPPVPAMAAPALSLVTGLNFELLMQGQRVRPEIALARGFQFNFETLPEALADLVKAGPKAWK